MQEMKKNPNKTPIKLQPRSKETKDNEKQTSNKPEDELYRRFVKTQTVPINSLVSEHLI